MNYRNLLVVFFITGLWHGAAWSFVVWGLYHGLFLIGEKLLFGRKINALTSPVLRLIYVLPVVLIGWVIFLRATLRSLGVIGIVLTTALFGCLLWLVIDTGIVATDNINVVLYLVLVLLAMILSIGMSIPAILQW